MLGNYLHYDMYRGSKCANAPSAGMTQETRTTALEKATQQQSAESNAALDRLDKKCIAKFGAIDELVQRNYGHFDDEVAKLNRRLTEKVVAIETRADEQERTLAENERRSVDGLREMGAKLSEVSGDLQLKADEQYNHFTGRCDGTELTLVEGLNEGISAVEKLTLEQETQHATLKLQVRERALASY